MTTALSSQRYMRRALVQVCVVTGCLALLGSSVGVNAQQPLQRHHQQETNEINSLPRQRHGSSRLVGLKQRDDNYDTLIDVDTLEELWENEALKAQEEANRLLGYSQHDYMSMVPTPAPVLQTIPPFMRPTPVVTTPSPSAITPTAGAPTVDTIVPTASAQPATGGTSPPTSADGCNGLSRDEFLLDTLSDVTDEETLQDTATPQGQAFVFLNVNDPLTANICTYPTVKQRYALVALYFSTNGNQWLNNTGWLTAANECSWYGIVCNDGVAVSNITLPQNNLEGTLPDEISALSTLTRLELFNNEIGSTIPEGIGNLTQLAVLDLEQNLFNGTLIPPELLQLTNLVNLFLSNNQFAGSIPSEISQLSVLESFWAADNQLVGSVPDTLGSLTNITSLILYNNLLDNSLQSAPFTQLTNLGNLQLWGNNFQGSLSTDIASLSQLSVLRLDFNFITGTIPEAIGNLTNLVDLRLSNNLLSGTLPSRLSSLSQLEYLILGTNFLTGQIPDIFGRNMPGLVALDLSFSGFTGTIPTSIFNSSTIEMVYLNNNALTGIIPPNYANAASLEELFLNNNLLNGTVPEIGPAQLLDLTEFALQFNSLTGTMPQGICNLREAGAGNLTQLLADCQGETPEIECDFPDCCTRCFDNSMNPAARRRRRILEMAMFLKRNATSFVRR